MLRAIAIGIDRYQDEKFDDLSCAASDARAVATLFESRIVPAEREVRLLVDAQATLRTITIAIDDLSRTVTEDDLVLIYFAGHGCPDRVAANDRRANYLLSHDSEYSHIHATSLGMETHVMDWLKRLSGARVLTIVLDACFSGGAGGRSVMGPLLRAARLETMDSPPVSLKGLNVGRGRGILCAADDNQLAQEDEATGHGVFTRHFLASLKRARPGKGVVRISEIYDEVEEAVRLETNNAQEPISTLIGNMRGSLPSLAET